MPADTDDTQATGEQHFALRCEPKADRRKALQDPDSTFQAQFYFDTERMETVSVEQASSSNTDQWDVYSVTGGRIEGISKGTKDGRMAIDGRYINLEDVPDDVRRFEEAVGICPTCANEEATEDPERDLTLFVSPDRTEGWVECDQDRGHRHEITEVLIRAH